MTNDNNAHPYELLTPDCVLSAIEQQDYCPNGSLLALNSYENRVYQVGLDDNSFIIAKFYRPERWTNEAIEEEHQFTFELAEQEIPVVAPLKQNNKSLFEYNGFRFALYPRQGGRAPELDNAETLRQLGRLLGRIHATGAQHPFQHRPRLTIESFGYSSLKFLLEHNFIAPELKHNYQQAANEALDIIEQRFEAVIPRNIRLHGDCHPGNILWTDKGAHFVDLDDSRSGPAVQDLWMLLSGTTVEMEQQFRLLLEGYQMFFEFDPAELVLIESLRTLRLIHYSAWLARRWNDPAFPQHFPWFNTPRYWEDQMLTLREQIERLESPPIKL